MLTKLLSFTDQRTAIWTDIMWALMGSCLLALASQVSVVLPFTTVPFSLQPHTVLFLAATLGSKRAFLSVVAFLGEGIIGLPVFAMGGSTLAVLLGTRGGYLMSYLVVSFVVGSLFERLKPQTALHCLGCLMVGSVITLTCGWSWLSLYLGPVNAWYAGVAPFLVNDFLKNLALTGLLAKILPLQRWA